jgi:hypothetical protein
MTSAINYIDIDQDFPVAGQDNESQGFRDNFSFIRQALEVAQGELSDLQSKAVFKTKLTNDLELDNNMSGSSIVNANLVAYTEKVYSVIEPINENPSVEGISIDYDFGHYQTFVVGGDLNFRLVSWPVAQNPADRVVAKVRVELRGKDAGPYTVDFTTAVTPSGSIGVIKFGPNWPVSLVVDSSSDPVILEFWTRDGGNTVYASYLGKFI